MTLKTLLVFFAGAAVGAIGMKYYLDKRYFGPIDEPDDEEEESPKVERESKSEKTTDDTNTEDETDEAARIEYNKVASQYTEETEKKAPYVISREEFNDGTMPTHCTYSYFEDGVFEDEYNDIVEDAEEALGFTAAQMAEMFKDNEDDLIYIRNEARYCDYEILREGITYKDPNEEE